MAKELREVWANCIGPDHTNYLGDEELAIIDAMEDSIAPLDKETAGIRGLITRFSRATYCWSSDRTTRSNGSNGGTPGWFRLEISPPRSRRVRGFKGARVQGDFGLPIGKPSSVSDQPF